MATESPAPAEQPTPVELMLKAVKGLPDEEERDQVLAWLIDRSATARTRALVRQAGGLPRLEPVIQQAALERYASLSGEHQGVLVRLPVDQHARLREWCEAHNFRMATVIRGLVDRFLAQQNIEGPDAGEE